MELSVELTLGVVFLISGRGTTMAAVLQAIKDGVLKHIEPAAVIADRECEGLEEALKFGLKRNQISIIRPKAFPDENSFGEAILRVCRQHEASLLSQNGWLSHTPRLVTWEFREFSINQHPGALDPGRVDFGGPGMYGKRVHAATLLYRRLCANPAGMWTEATVHRVEQEYDKGAVIGRVRLAIEKSDTPETLATRLLPLEHQLVIDTMQGFTECRVKELPPRRKSLIQPEFADVLSCVKHSAKLLYPKG